MNFAEKHLLRQSAINAVPLEISKAQKANASEEEIHDVIHQYCLELINYAEQHGYPLPQDGDINKLMELYLPIFKQKQ